MEAEQKQQARCVGFRRATPRCAEVGQINSRKSSPCPLPFEDNGMILPSHLSSVQICRKETRKLYRAMKLHREQRPRVVRQARWRPAQQIRKQLTLSKRINSEQQSGEDNLCSGQMAKRGIVLAAMTWRRNSKLLTNLWQWT